MARQREGYYIFRFPFFVSFICEQLAFGVMISRDHRQWQLPDLRSARCLTLSTWYIIRKRSQAIARIADRTASQQTIMSMTLTFQGHVTTSVT